jgi:hypothetical protein
MGEWRTYIAEATRKRGWWEVRVPEVGCSPMQARRLDQVEWMARQAICAQLDADPASFDVEVAAQLPASLQARLAEERELRRNADLAGGRTSALAAELVGELFASGLAVSDVGWLLGVSYRRVAQLASLRAADL